MNRDQPHHAHVDFWLRSPDAPGNRSRTTDERVAVLEVEARHMMKAVTDITEDVKQIDASVKNIEKTLTTAGGVKIALIAIGSLVMFLATQAWQFLGLKGLR